MFSRIAIAVLSLVAFCSAEAPINSNQTIFDALFGENQAKFDRGCLGVFSALAVNNSINIADQQARIARLKTEGKFPAEWDIDLSVADRDTNGELNKTELCDTIEQVFKQHSTTQLQTLKVSPEVTQRIVGPVCNNQTGLKVFFVRDLCTKIDSMVNEHGVNTTATPEKSGALVKRADGSKIVWGTVNIAFGILLTIFGVVSAGVPVFGPALLVLQVFLGIVFFILGVSQVSAGIFAKPPPPPPVAYPVPVAVAVPAARAHYH